VLLLLGSWFSRIIVVVAAAVAVPCFFTTTVTVSEPPAVSELLLNDTLCEIRSGCNFNTYRLGKTGNRRPRRLS
jgi:hypothetical protein